MTFKIYLTREQKLLNINTRLASSSASFLSSSPSSRTHDGTRRQNERKRKQNDDNKSKVCFIKRYETQSDKRRRQRNYSSGTHSAGKEEGEIELNFHSDA